MSASDPLKTAQAAAAAAPNPIPTPVSGASSADLTTESNDPQELRTLLERARERLSFYESFDRIIGENLRRTGEMMEETVALREQAAQAAARAAEERAAADAALQAERERYRALLENALAEVRAAQPVINSMVTRLQGALDEISADHDAPGTPSTPESETIVEPEAPASHDETPVEPEPNPAKEPHGDPENIVEVTAPEEDEPEHAEPDEEILATEEEKDVPPLPAEETGPQVLDVLAHGVPSAATAIGLQQMLRDLDPVTRVDAREFADGELRLHVECTGALPETPLADWLSRNSGSLVSRNGKAIELTFS